MGNIISILTKMCAKEEEKELQIHDVDIVCCSTIQESSSDSERERGRRTPHQPNCSRLASVALLIPTRRCALVRCTD